MGETEKNIILILYDGTMKYINNLLKEVSN